MELRAELRGRDGAQRALRVRCEPEGELRGLLSGLVQLRQKVAALLGPLVERESGAGDRAGAGDGGDEDEQDEDEDEEENHVNAQTCPVGPPLKRKKTHTDKTF